jgi:hypothetical protein
MQSAPLMYFYLVRSFGEGHLNMDATLTDENINHLLVNTGQALDQIIADLKLAEGKAVTTFGNQPSE